MTVEYNLINDKTEKLRTNIFKEDISFNSVLKVLSLFIWVKYRPEYSQLSEN
jgi:hypothetical protein